MNQEAIKNNGHMFLIKIVLGWQEVFQIHYLGSSMVYTDGVDSSKYAVGEFVLVYIIQSLNLKNMLLQWKYFNKTIYLDKLFNRT